MLSKIKYKVENLKTIQQAELHGGKNKQWIREGVAESKLSDDTAEAEKVKTQTSQFPAAFRYRMEHPGQSKSLQPYTHGVQD